VSVCVAEKALVLKGYPQESQPSCANPEEHLELSYELNRCTFDPYLWQYVIATCPKKYLEDDVWTLTGYTDGTCKFKSGLYASGTHGKCVTITPGRVAQVFCYIGFQAWIVSLVIALVLGILPIIYHIWKQYAADVLQFGDSLHVCLFREANGVVRVSLCLISFCLICLILEEYNSRNDGDFRIWFQLLGSAALFGIAFFYPQQKPQEAAVGAAANADNDKYFEGIALFWYLVYLFLPHIGNIWYAAEDTADRSKAIILGFEVGCVVISIIFLSFWRWRRVGPLGGNAFWLWFWESFAFIFTMAMILGCSIKRNNKVA